jgi:threonine 3-dehydrogenase
MKAIYKAKPELGGLEMRDIPIPEPGFGQALIKMKTVAICGTDLHIYNWDAWSQNRVSLPTIIGHEFAGEIVKVGPGVSHFKVGDYVSGEGHLTCGFCKMCRTGQGHVCEDWVGLGYDVDGCFAEYLVMPERNLWKNDTSLDPDVCSIQDPLGNAVHTVFKADCVGKNVAVFGMGPVGLLSVAILKAIGAEKIIAVGRRNEYRLDLAKQCGATHVLKSSELDDVPAEIRKIVGGKGVDVSLEIAGAKQAILDAMACVRPNGSTVLLGIPTEPVPMNVASDIVFKSLNIHGITGRKIWDTWYRMAGLLNSGKLDVKPIITHRFKFEDYVEGFELMRTGNCGKVVLDFD